MALHSNEKFTREVCSVLSDSLGVPYDLVRSIVDGVGLYILEKVAEEGRIAEEEGKEAFTIDMPMVGTLTVFPKKYPETENSILEGRALRTKFKVREPFLLKMRYAYYTDKHYLEENISENFEKFLAQRYSNLISEEGKEEFNHD